METYQKRQFTFAILENIPENEDEFVTLGVDVTGYYPNLAIVVNRELAVVEETYPTMVEALARYEVTPA